LLFFLFNGEIGYDGRDKGKQEKEQNLKEQINILIN
jgi:hypothetical protein